ncbi:hypothetical protein IT401_01880 [Candidatus Nomurabacteria bacterium]|nr:hypothetical protein [Candidatus Nomurabacteria bacterium]
MISYSSFRQTFNKFFSKLPVAVLLLICAIGVGLVDAQFDPSNSSWFPPTATPPNNDVKNLLNVSQTSQAKGGGEAIPGSLLDIDDVTNQNDIFATNTLSVWQDTKVIDGSTYVLSLAGPKYLCSDNTGKITTCMPVIVPDTEIPDDDDEGEPGIPGGSGGWQSLYACFIAGTKVTMADGTYKLIEDVKIGDVLKGETGNNTVLAFHRPPKSDGIIYGFNGEKPFVTAEHPFMTTEGWKSLNPEKTKKENIGIKVTKLEEGDELITEHGTEKIEMITSEKVSQNTPLYNFVLSGDRTYYADEYLVHNKTPCWSPETGYLLPCIDTSITPYLMSNIEQSSAIQPTWCTNVGYVQISHQGEGAQYIGNCGGSYVYLGCYDNGGAYGHTGVLACGNSHP